MTRGIPFVSVFLSPEVLGSLTLLTSVSINVLGYPLFKNQDVVACTCNPATLEAEFQNGVGSIPVGGNSPSIGGWIV